MNWEIYDTSILATSSYTHYHLVEDYDSKYIKNFKQKLKIVQQYNTSKSGVSKHEQEDMCGALFYPLFRAPVWVMIGCDVVLYDTYFLCEHHREVQFHHAYARDSYQCRKGSFFALYSCWEIISKFVMTTRIPLDVSILQLHLSGWALGHASRTLLGVGYMDKKHYCYSTKAFLYQPIKSFTESTDCGDTRLRHHLLRSEPFKYNYICDTKYHHTCDQGTCILHTYICDGISDCFDKTDENNCHAPLNAYIQACDQNVKPCKTNSLVYEGCDEMYYECLSGECVPLAHRCDHQADCQDNSDERTCPFYDITYTLRTNIMTEVSLINLDLILNYNLYK